MICALPALLQTSRRLPALLSLLILVVLLWPLFTGDESPGSGAEARQRHGHWVVVQVDAGSLAALAGLRVGDTVVALNGSHRFTRRRSDPGIDFGRPRAWTVTRAGHILHLRSTLATNLAEPIVLLALALAFWAIGTFLWLSKPADRLVHRLYWMNVAMAGALALSSPAGNDVVWARVLEMAAYAALPALFFSAFTAVSGEDQPGGRARYVTRILYGAGALAGVLAVVAGLAGSSWFDTFTTALLALVATGFISGLVALGHAYARPSTRHTRRQVAVVFAGAALAVLPLTILAIVPSIAGQPPLVAPQIAALSTIFLPASLAYAVFRHRWLEIDVIIGRTLVYGAMTVLLAGCYAGFLSLLQRSRLDHYPASPFLWLLFFAAVTLTFTAIRERVRALIDGLIYRDRYDYARTLRDLGAELASMHPLDEALTAVAQSLTMAMNLRGAAILLRQPEGGFAVRGASGDCLDPTRQQQLVDTISAGGAGTTEGRWVPLIARGEERGLLYLGPKSRPSELSDQDVILVETLAQQAAAAVANAVLADELHHSVAEMVVLRDRLLHVQDEERKSLAQDIHDGALHRLWNLVRQAEAAMSPVPGGPDPLTSLQVLAELGRDAAYELRMTCSRLYPSELTHLGLPLSLRQLADTTSMDEEVRVRFHASRHTDDLPFSEEIGATLYRVAREAVTNTVRHSGASEAHITLTIEDDAMVLIVSDDGDGFMLPPLPALVDRGHLGLVGMRDRVHRLGGSFAVISAPGEGTEITARIAIPRVQPIALDRVAEKV